MVKYPFSKKFVNLMIATALVVTPVAATVPVGGSVVEASEVTVDSFVNKLVSIYDQMDVTHKNTINSLKGELGDVNWSNVLGDLEDTIDGKTTTGKASEIATKVAEIVYSTEKTALNSAVTTFRSDYSDEFHTIFEGTVTVDDFLDFFLAFEAHMKSKSITELLSELSKANFDSSKFMEDNINQVVESSSKYTTLENNIKTHTGLTFNELFDMKSRLDTAVGLSETQKSELRAAFIEAVSKALDSGSVGGGIAPDTEVAVPTRPGVSADATSAISDGTVNGGQLGLIIADNANADRVNFNIQDSSSLKFPQAALEALVNAANDNLIVDIDVAKGSVSISAKELTASKLGELLDLAEGEEFEVEVSVASASTEEAAAATKRIEASPKGLKVRSDIVDFSFVVHAGDKSEEVKAFNSYVFRSIPVNNVTNVKNLVVYNVDGEPVAVPTKAEEKVVTFGTFNFSNYVVVEREPVVFPDLGNHWSKDAINDLSIRDVIEGFQDGEVKPRRVTTRAEFAAMLTRSLSLPEAGAYTNQFNDVQGSEWYVSALLPAVEAGLIVGRQNGTFAPNAPITREEAATIVSRALELFELREGALDSSKSLNQFSDKSAIANWATDAVEEAVQAGIIEGRANGSFDAKGDTQRAEVAAMIQRLLKKGDLL
ncbi:S-layer homology domain-containing protein [Halalkalibacter urbisdiaboli]|uniref:S-layer homology domain-containing protein n=1 Tax=Halalkalibacter urbisdiaboli TaxID=1960589 RepID=UPI000B43B4B7|nr:S-layer homology domain-containing protein [Halalkalibacter urbisdiaboli]